ncbi:LysR family transcriptional regulator [Rhodococcoides yunnanense]|uniref:LysR family transcriptional regulator n=1 Tax=Rhodococcoides yunnanense TaxID=278209 RepID=UPI0009327984|nr:LysR family transcriptional regulator [Rhodococcus yunnanensis]
MDESILRYADAVAPLLGAFDSVATEGHVTRAAELLGVPQSSVSRRVKALEAAVGLALFQPAGRGVALTVSGRELYDLIHPIVQALDDAVAVVRDNADPSRGLVRFGCPLTMDAVRIAQVLANFHTAAPDVRVHLIQAHGEAIAGMIRDGRLDLALMIPPVDDLPNIPIGTQRIDLHVSTSHPLAGREEVHLGELQDCAFIASPRTFHLRTLLDSWCKEEGFVPRVHFEINEIDTIRVLVARGLGVALLPPGPAADDGTISVPLAGHRRRRIGLASGNHRPTAAVHRFREHVVRSFR